MQKYTYEAKNYEEAVALALKELNTTPENLLIKVLEEKKTLFTKNTKIEVIVINDIINYIKAKITEITKLMDLEVNIETRRREDQICIKLFSNNNAILIGKNGKNIKALELIIRQIIQAQTGEYLKVNLDVENYRENRNRSIEKLAQEIAKEVASTQVEVKLDRMNSYERRLVHNILSTNPDVCTTSIGEEPDRCVVIKPTESN